MASVVLENVTVDFPIYGSQSSLRKELFTRAIGGLIRREGTHHRRVTVRALSEVCLRLGDGDRLGLVGHNGAGKSTLLRVLARVYEPVQGRVAITGRVSPLFDTSPGLDTDDTGYENIRTCGLLLGMTRAEIARKIPEIEQFSELSEYLSLPVRTYSSGMMTRLSFSIGTAIDPEILLLDEGLDAGDARFAARVAQRVAELIARSRMLVLASHSLDLIRSLCNRAILLESGRIVATGSPDEVIELYRQSNQIAAEGPLRLVGAE